MISRRKKEKEKNIVSIKENVQVEQGRRRSDATTEGVTQIIFQYFSFVQLTLKLLTNRKQIK